MTRLFRSLCVISAVAVAVFCGLSVGYLAPVGHDISPADAATCVGPVNVVAFANYWKKGSKATLSVAPGTVLCVHVNSILVLDTVSHVASVEIGWNRTTLNNCNGIPSNGTYIFWTRKTLAGNGWQYNCNWDHTPVSSGDTPTVSVRYNNSTQLWQYYWGSKNETNWYASFDGGISITNSERHNSGDSGNAYFSMPAYYDASNSTWYTWPAGSTYLDCDSHYHQTVSIYSDYHGLYASVSVVAQDDGQPPAGCDPAF